MAQMGAAFAAGDFGADHAVGIVRCGFNCDWRGIPEGWPAGTGVVFGIRIKKFLTADHTMI